VLGSLGEFPSSTTIVAAALCGAMIGFAPFNRPVAKVFLGDVGSLPIGLLLGWCLLELAFRQHVIAALLLPLYYLADATMTLLRRRRSVFACGAGPITPVTLVYAPAPERLVAMFENSIPHEPGSQKGNSTAHHVQHLQHIPILIKTITYNLRAHAKRHDQSDCARPGAACLLSADPSGLRFR